MKRASLAGLVVLSLSVGLLVAHQQHARARQVATPAVVAPLPAAADQVPITSAEAEAEPCAKKCSFDSDCPYGKCKGGTCGGCGFDSDCKGWGKCKGGSCGACGFDSDCKGFGNCSGGRCAKSPY